MRLLISKGDEYRSKLSDQAKARYDKLSPVEKKTERSAPGSYTHSASYPNPEDAHPSVPGMSRREVKDLRIDKHPLSRVKAGDSKRGRNLQRETSSTYGGTLGRSAPTNRTKLMKLGRENRKRGASYGQRATVKTRVSKRPSSTRKKRKAPIPKSPQPPKMATTAEKPPIKVTAESHAFKAVAPAQESRRMYRTEQSDTGRKVRLGQAAAVREERDTGKILHTHRSMYKSLDHMMNMFKDNATRFPKNQSSPKSPKATPVAGSGKKPPVKKSYGKWGKKDKDDEMKRTELYPVEQSGMAKACGHKVPCPPDCPNFKKSQSFPFASRYPGGITPQATAILRSVKDSLAKMGKPVTNVEFVEVSKALSTRNFAMPRISAMKARYDANQVYRSAMTQTSRQHSRLAPPVQQTLDDVKESEPLRTQPLIRSMCQAHGLMHKSEEGCPACRMAKSLETVRPDVRYNLR